MTATATAPTRATPKRLSALDRWLPLWIGLAMIAGLLLGRLVPAVSDVLAHLEVGGISVPIGLGLLVMMYPVLAKVRYDKIAAATGERLEPAFGGATPSPFCSRDLNMPVL